MTLSKRSFIVVVILIMLIVYLPVSAQGGDEAYYIVHEGDALWSIAARFGVSLDELQQENNITDPSQVGIGARLVVPGLQGIGGELDTITVSYGETLRSLRHRYGISEQALARVNRLVSPSEVYAGTTFIVPNKEDLSTAKISPLVAG